MRKIRNYCVSIIVVFGLVSFVSHVVTFSSDMTSQLPILLVDLEDNTGSTEDQQGEKQGKEYRLSKSANYSLRSLQLTAGSIFGQVNNASILEVYLEVFTPPPEYI